MTAQQRLDDARAQYHLLITGQAARVIVDQNGERFEYQLANAGRLAAYISSLERAIGTSNLGPMRVLM